MKQLSLAVLLLLGPVAFALAEPPKPQSHIERTIDGWTVHVDGRLLVEPGKTIGDRALRLLAHRLNAVALGVPTDKLTWLQRVAFTQGGRVPVACDDILLDKQIPVPHRIYVWDTADGSLAHQIEVPAGLPKNIEVSPNSRHLLAAIEDSDGIKLSGWRLDGREPRKEADGAPPAATQPR